jgi:hypothetical protein
MQNPPFTHRPGLLYNRCAIGAGRARPTYTSVTLSL